MSDLLPRIRAAGSAVSPDDLVADLVELHTQRPGVTEATLGALRTDDGRTGYDVLVDALPSSSRAVLDLGCGNGPMLERLLRREPRLHRVVGLDACGPEIERARHRLGDEPRLALHVGRAASLPLEDASLDAVLSHHALYLFVPIEPVLTEIARVLRPGGVLVFATLSPHLKEPLFDALMADFGPLTKKENPSFKGWGDPRMWSDDGLHALFATAFDPPEITDFTVAIEEPPAALAERLMRFFYSVDLQSAATRDELRRAWTATLEAAAKDGQTRFVFPSAFVVAHKRG